MENQKKESASKKAYREYQESLAREKDKIKSDPNKNRRFWRWLWLIIKFPWQWLWMACHDWHLILIYVAWMAIVGSEVWIPLVLGILSPDPSFKAWMLSIASACETFWLLPLTPFMPICIALTIGTKAILDRRKNKNG